MSKKIKIFVYWFSVVLPVIDILKGAVAGIKVAFESVKTERAEELARKKYEEMKERFLNDN